MRVYNIGDTLDISFAIWPGDNSYSCYGIVIGIVDPGKYIYVDYDLYFYVDTTSYPYTAKTLMQWRINP